MSSYLITGASRGLGFEFVRQLSDDPKNTVIGLVRNKKAADEKITQELPGRDNLHIIQADINDYEALKASVEETSKLTGGGLDVIIANAVYAAPSSAYYPMGVLYAAPPHMDEHTDVSDNLGQNSGQHPEKLEADLLESFKVNVVANVHLFNLFMPLVQKGKAKKVITISSGMADLDLITKFGVAIAGPYAISKAAVNAAVAKFDAEYRREGVLFMSISPGVVDTGHYEDMTEEQAKGAAEMLKQFAAYAPDFKGPVTPESSVKDVLSVIRNSSLEAGNGGSFVSHFGNKQWL
ncbi:hypothetical protein ACJ41O_014301 [Fusarium nematophilum]